MLGQYCYECGTALSAGGAFCRNCGTAAFRSAVPTLPSSQRTELFCSVCGGKNPRGFSFCRHCGHAVDELPWTAPPDASPDASTGLTTTSLMSSEGFRATVNEGTCASCGTTLAPDSEFCPGCWTRVAEPRASKAAQKRTAQSGLNSAVRVAYGVIYFLGIVNFVLGCVGIFGDVEILREMFYLYYTLGFGVVLLGLGFLVQKRSKAALIAAISICALDAMVGFFMSIAQGNILAIAPLVVRIALISMMYKGVDAIDTLKHQPRKPAGY